MIRSTFESSVGVSTLRPRVWAWIVLGAALALTAAACSTRENPLVQPLLALDDLQYDAGILISKAEDFYKEEDYDQAAAEYERFLDLHPTHRWAVHAQFKLALCYAHRVPKVGRDPAPAEQAAAAFERVISTYPGSRYEEAARAELAKVQNHLAAAELSVGRFYFKKGDYLAAIVRFQRALNAHASPSVAEDARYLLALAYDRSGQAQQAGEAARALLETFPQTRHAKEAERLRARIQDGAS